jgi:chemotaxis protein methyltransferase CheR
LIYFDTESRKKVIDTFYERLLPGGYLFLGHSESLLNLSTAFELVHLSRDMIYRRPEMRLRPTASRAQRLAPRISTTRDREKP